MIKKDKITIYTLFFCFILSYVNYNSYPGISVTPHKDPNSYIQSRKLCLPQLMNHTYKSPYNITYTPHTPQTVTYSQSQALFVFPNHPLLPLPPSHPCLDQYRQIIFTVGCLTHTETVRLPLTANEMFKKDNNNSEQHGEGHGGRFNNNSFDSPARPCVYFFPLHHCFFFIVFYSSVFFPRRALSGLDHPSSSNLKLTTEKLADGKIHVSQSPFEQI